MILEGTYKSSKQIRLMDVLIGDEKLIALEDKESGYTGSFSASILNMVTITIPSETTIRIPEGCRVAAFVLNPDGSLSNEQLKEAR